jgi:hypothetical protein
LVETRSCGRRLGFCQQQSISPEALILTDDGERKVSRREFLFFLFPPLPTQHDHATRDPLDSMRLQLGKLSLTCRSQKDHGKDQQPTPLNGR